jgi:ABC-2 type transport system permease protein
MLRHLVLKDLRRWWSDRNAVVITLLLPLLLSAALGVSFGGFGGGSPASVKVPLALVGDVPPLVRDQLLDAIAKTDYFAPVWADSATARTLVTEGKARAAVLLPDDLLECYFSGRRVAIGLWKDPVSVFQADIVEQVLTRVLLKLRAGEAAYFGAWQQDWFPADGEVSAIADLFAGDSGIDVWKRVLAGGPVVDAAVAQMKVVLDHQVVLQDSWSSPAVSLQLVDRSGLDVSDGRDARASRNMFDWILPGMAVFFLMFAAGNAGGDLHRERELGSLRRLLCAPLGEADLLLGKWLYAMINGLLQIGVLLLVGRLIFRLNLGPDPWVLPLVAVATSAMLASLFLPLALVTRSEKQMGQIATGVILFMAIMGGNFIPSDQMPAFLQAAGRFTPNYWANSAFNSVIAYGDGLAVVWTRLAVMAGISATFLSLALLLYRRRGGKEGLL